MRSKVAFAAAVLAGAVLVVLMSKQARQAIVDLTERGLRLTRTAVNSDGWIPIEPEQLRREAEATLARAGRPTSISSEEYALARMVRSEEGSASPQIKRMILWVALNDAAQLRWTPERLITFSRTPAKNGFYGTQAGRRYSSRFDPYEIDLALARQVIADFDAGRADPTKGAVKFVRRALLGEDRYAEVLADWGREGLRPVVIPPAPADLVFFRRVG